MTINRVTQNMMMNRSYLSLQTGLNRLSKTQEQLTTGRVLNRPSDSPTDTTSAMRMRAALAEEKQYTRNAEDGLGWLGQIDTQLTSMLGQVRRGRELALQGANASFASPQARESLAAEVDQLREGLISAANATYLGRPVFGGMVPGGAAYDAAGSFVGVPGDVVRTIAKDVKVQVNVNGPDAFGPPGADVFAELEALSVALRAGDQAGISNAISTLAVAQDRITATLADVGTRYNRLDRAVQTSFDTSLSLSTSLSEIENVDLAKASMELGLHEVAYQAALASTARLVQPSLVEFLR